MKTTEVLYTRNFTDLGPLQSAHILQYALTTDPGCALRYGFPLRCCRPEAGTRNPAGQSAIRRRGLAVFLFSCGKMRWSRAPCGDCGGHRARGPFAVRRGRVSGLYG